MRRSTSSTTCSALARRLRSRQAVVGVVGLGYVGLPHARLFARKGFRVIGVDIDPAKIASLRAGRSYIASVPSAEIRRWDFEPTTEFAPLEEADAVILCVPTPLTRSGRPDLSFVRRTSRSVAAVLRRGQLIVLESTTHPGTTREIVLVELERGGLRCGRDFWLAYSPEREDPGNRSFRTEDIPKIVAGIDGPSLAAARTLYGSVVRRVVPVSSVEVAEAGKLVENVYRGVNIALVNELKMVLDRMGIDVAEVLAAAATKPFGFQAFAPGPGMGGHCVPIDPFYLYWRAKEFGAEARFIKLAGEVNRAMPGWVVGKLRAAMKRPLKGARVLVLGLAYKKDIDDPRESPAWEIMDQLVRAGARISYNDPYIPSLPITRRWSHLSVPWIPVTRSTLRAQHAVVLVTDHGAYDYPQIARCSRLVVDTRGVLRGIPGRIIRA